MLCIRLRFFAVVMLAIGAAATGTIVYGRGPQDAPPTNDPPVSNQPAAPAPQNSKEVAPDQSPLRRALDEAVTAARAISDPSARRSARVRIADAQARSSDLAAARATLHLAQQSAEAIASEMAREFGLWRVAKAQAKLGDVEPARQIFQGLIRIADGKAPWDRMSLLGNIAIAQDAGGLRADAVETLNRVVAAAREVADKTSNGDIYFHIVFAQCQLSDFDGALRIAESLQGDQTRYRQTYLHYIARDCRKAGPARARTILAKSLELSKGIKDIYPRGLSQKMIAQAMAQNGDISGALEAMKLIGQLDEAPAETGILSFFPDRQAAARRQADKHLAEQVRHEAADVLAAIAAQQAKLGDRAAAKKTFGEAMGLILAERDGVIKTQRLRGLAEALAGSGELEAAKVAIDAIHDDEANKALALVALAKAQAASGNKPGASESLSTAAETANQTKALTNLINDNVARRKDETFRAIAVAQVELGEIEASLATVSAHDNKALKSEIEAEVAGLKARRGDIGGALKTAERIADAGSRAEALSKIAHAQSWTDQGQAALVWSSKLSLPQERALALVGVAEGVLARRNRE